jgi:predicted dehydrogenase
LWICCGDHASLHLQFADGSIGTVHYFANGDSRWPKERLEIFTAGRVLQLDNFRTLTGWGWKDFSRFKTGSPDKGHNAEVAAFLDAVRLGRPSPIPPAEILEVSRASIALAQSRAASVS